MDIRPGGGQLAVVVLNHRLCLQSRDLLMRRVLIRVVACAEEGLDAVGDDALEGGPHKGVACVCLVHMRVGHVQGHIVDRVH